MKLWKNLKLKKNQEGNILKKCGGIIEGKKSCGMIGCHVSFFNVYFLVKKY